VTDYTLSRLGNSAFLVVNGRLVEPGHVTHCAVSFYLETDDAPGVVLKVTVQTAVVTVGTSVTVCIRIKNGCLPKADGLSAGLTGPG
jgi:ABC-type antimicrobial peptide transport system permease subunit